MATEYNTRPGGGLQWRDKSRGVDGWNNIDNSDPNSWPPGYKPPAQAAAPKPAAAAPSGAPSSAGSAGSAGAPASSGGGGVPPAPGALPSMAALNKVVTPDATALPGAAPTSVDAMTGGGGGGGTPSVIGEAPGMLRPLGRGRLQASGSMALAGLGRRVY